MLIIADVLPNPHHLFPPSSPAPALITTQSRPFFLPAHDQGQHWGVCLFGLPVHNLTRAYTLCLSPSVSISVTHKHRNMRIFIILEYYICCSIACFPPRTHFKKGQEGEIDSILARPHLGRASQASLHAMQPRAGVAMGRSRGCLLCDTCMVTLQATGWVFCVSPDPVPGSPWSGTGHPHAD